MLRPITPCPLCGRNTRFWPPGSNYKWECNAIDLSWPGVIDAGRDMTNDGTVQLLLSPERQPTFAIHKHCLWVLCRDGSVSYMDAYRLCRSLQQEKGDEPGFDSIIDPLHLFDSPDPFDSRNYESILGQKKQVLVPMSCDALEEPQPVPLERLPLELLHGVFEHLPLYSLMACSYVSTYIEAAVQGFCTSDPLMKHAITRFAGLSTIPDGWDLIRRQFSSSRNQTMNMIDNFWQLLDNTRSLRRIQVTERTSFDAKLRPLDIELPVTFYTQRVRRRQYVCGIRLHDGRVFGVETKAVHRTNAALDKETPLRLFFDGLGVHGIGVGTYFWKDPAARRSEVFCWGLDSGFSVPCVFDGCKIRLRSASPDSPSETPEPSGPMAILVH